MKRIISEYGKPILFALFAAILITSVVRPTLVREYSMYPTISPYSYIIVNRMPYLLSMPSYNDIVVFNSNIVTEHNEGRRLVKRIIGIGGDTIEIKDGDVYRNGKKLTEDYIIEDASSGEMEPFTVTENHVFVMGDNRPVSLDSRNSAVGEIAMKDILGRVDLRIFPFSQIGAIK